MSRKLFSVLEILFITALACVPLFATFPYRVNIFLSWEGAYRLSQGQIPFRDFGSPLGGMYWVVPGLFFKIFGAKMISLIKAQVFLNIVSGLAFRSILKSVQVQTGVRFISVILFCLSYSFINFWPWYNHTVIVYELAALAFLFKYLTAGASKKHTSFLLAAAAIFVCFSFLTKQDGGGMALIICLALLSYHCIIEKKWMALLLFTGYFAFAFGAVILWFSQYKFGYWFNHGQPPHSARISIPEIANEFFDSSEWIKFYLFLIVLLMISRFKSWHQILNNKKEGLSLLLTLAILGEAAVFQVTSYTPPDNNIFFHSFAFAFIISQIAHITSINFSNPKIILLSFAGIMLWWSGTYWKYIQRTIERAFPGNEVAAISSTGENVVNKNTYMIKKEDTLDIPMTKWVYVPGLKSFEKIYMPKPTAEGIQRLLKMDLVKNNKNIHVLNMSELTPLAVEMPYELERSKNYPLWFHLGVGMFNKEAAMFETRIANHYYDLVLFENIETLNNFYPFRIRDSLKVHYNLVDSFMAPRRGDTRGIIEVYKK